MSRQESPPGGSLNLEDTLDSEDVLEETPIISKHHFSFCTNPEEKQDDGIPEGNFMSSLLELSDDNSYPVLKGQHIYADDWDEAVFGWKDLVPNTKYFPHRKRKKNNEIETDKQKGTVKTNTNTSKSNESQSRAIWKSNVEPVTYRYIPNNGQYRIHKFIKEERDWYTVRRKNAERITPTLQARHVQREIKRLMKKDFSRKSSPDESNTKKDVKRSHSTSSEGCRERSSCSLKTLVKSASDLYVENIPIRLKELDCEIKRDSQIRKSHEDQNRPFPFSVTKGKLHPKLKESPTPPRRGVYDAQSTFFLTPVGAKDSLRPLEKITPQQRMKEDLLKAAAKKPVKDTGGGDISKNETEIAKSAIEVTNCDLERMRILPLEKTSRTYFDRIVKSKDENTSVLTASIKKRMGTQFISSITMDDEGLGNMEELGLGDPDLPISTSRSSSLKDQNLPEIAGRRLEVSVTNYRYL